MSGDAVNDQDPAGLYGLDNFLFDAGNVSAGFGDTITSGGGLFDTSLTELARQALPGGVDDVVDKCGAGYAVGRGGAYAWLAATFGIGSTPRGWLFGRGGSGVLNSNEYIRIGWGWKGSAQAGNEVFRIAVGSKRLPFHWHFP